LLIVFALIAAVFIVAQGKIAWADFTSDVSLSSPAQDNPAQVHPSTGVFRGTVGTCADVVTIGEDGDEESYCVGSISGIDVGDFVDDQDWQVTAAVFEEDVYPEFLDALEDVTFPDGLAFPDAYADLPDFPPDPLTAGDLLAPPTFVIFSVDGAYVGDVTGEGYAEDDFKICYPVPPGATGHISFFGISGDPVEWGAEEALATTFETDEEGNIMISFTMPESLTKWKMMGLAYTKDLQIGNIIKTLVTQKELMVIPNPPRFFRQGDELEFAAKIVNLSEAVLNGEVTLEFFDAISMQKVNIFSA